MADPPLASQQPSPPNAPIQSGSGSGWAHSAPVTSADPPVTCGTDSQQSPRPFDEKALPANTNPANIANTNTANTNTNTANITADLTKPLLDSASQREPATHTKDVQGAAKEALTGHAPDGIPHCYPATLLSWFLRFRILSRFRRFSQMLCNPPSEISVNIACHQFDHSNATRTCAGYTAYISQVHCLGFFSSVYSLFTPFAHA